jgi:starvation-inducible DNA-binding protein
MYDIEEELEGHKLLASELTGLLGDTVVFKFQAHGFHWNVKGQDFNEFHEFFGEIYEDAEEAIDNTAELIRQLRYDAPFLLTDLAELACYTPAAAGSDPISMCNSLMQANSMIIEHLKNIFDVATQCREQGVANFLADRQAAHSKLQWKLVATLGLEREDY